MRSIPALNARRELLITCTRFLMLVWELRYAKGILAVSPMVRIERVPSPGESDHGRVLDANGLRNLIAGFRGSPLFPIVAAAAFTGARRNEILPSAGSISICRIRRCA